MQLSGHASQHPHWSAPGRCPDFPHLPAAEEWLPSLQCINFEGNKYYLISYSYGCCSIQLGTRLLCVPPRVGALRAAVCLPQEKQTSGDGEWVAVASAPPWHREGLLEGETAKESACREFASALQNLHRPSLSTSPPQLHFIAGPPTCSSSSPSVFFPCCTSLCLPFPEKAMAIT